MIKIDLTNIEVNYVYDKKQQQQIWSKKRNHKLKYVTSVKVHILYHKILKQCYFTQIHHSYNLKLRA